MLRSESPVEASRVEGPAGACPESRRRARPPAVYGASASYLMNQAVARNGALTS